MNIMTTTDASACATAWLGDMVAACMPPPGPSPPGVDQGFKSEEIEWEKTLNLVLKGPISFRLLGHGVRFERISSLSAAMNFLCFIKSGKDQGQGC